MKKDAVLSLFGNAKRAAKALGITHQAVYKWPDEVPRKSEREVRRVLRAFLKAAGPAT
jgi:Xaa-Pro aminopeptidase